MFRYLKEAFVARSVLPGLGAIPWNVLGVVGVGILGFAEPSIWLAGLGIETVYLFGLASNARFQRWVDGQALLEARSHAPAEPDATTLGVAAKERVKTLQEKIGRIEALYRQNDSEEYLFASNREALGKLAALFLKLLIAQKNIVTHAAAPAGGELERQIAKLNAELVGDKGSQTLRDSKRATLQIVEQRLRNVQRRDETLAEIDSDLTRIEEQIDLALEDATLKGRPVAISANIGLVSHLLDDSFLDSPATSSTARNPEVEN